MVCTRLDLAFAVSTIAKYMANPGPNHWTAVKRIFHYLQGTLSKGLVYHKSSTSPLLLHVFTDADWGGDLDTRRLTGGYCFLLSQAAICWSSKKQPSVSLSSTEAEYMALSKAAIEAIWLQRLLTDLGFPQ